MNSGAEWLAKRVVKEIEEKGGRKAFGTHALTNLKLKAIVRESHSSPVLALNLNSTHPDLNNLAATVGGLQATVYDDQYLQKHVNIVVHFTNEETDRTPGGGLSCCDWICCNEDPSEKCEDAILAVAGSDPNVTIISVVQSKVVSLLRGHKQGVVCLSAPRRVCGLLASLGKDQTLIIWDVSAEQSILTLQLSKATCMAWHPDGSYLLIGKRDGSVEKLDMSLIKNDAGLWECKNECDKSQGIEFGQHHHPEPVDRIIYLNESNFAVRWCNGYVCVWNMDKGELESTFKIPGCGLGLAATHCGINATPDGEIICAGNASGSIYLFDSATGDKISHVNVDRLPGPVHACGISHNRMHVMGSVGNGYIFRFQYSPQKNDENSPDNVQENVNEQGS